MSRKTELTELHKKGKVDNYLATPVDSQRPWKAITFKEAAVILREEACILRASGDRQMAAYLKRWAQRFE